MNRKVKLTLAVITTTILISGGIFYGINVTLAENSKPIGSENQTYILNPEPILKNNSDKGEQLLSKKNEILSKFQLKGNDKIISAELKTWKEYNTTDGDNGKNSQVDDNRLVYVVKISKPDGVDTKGGFFKNATVIQIIDAETEKPIGMDVKGIRDPNSGPFQNLSKNEKLN